MPNELKIANYCVRCRHVSFSYSRGERTFRDVMWCDALLLLCTRCLDWIVLPFSSNRFGSFSCLLAFLAARIAWPTHFKFYIYYIPVWLFLPRRWSLWLRALKSSPVHSIFISLHPSSRLALIPVATWVTDENRTNIGGGYGTNSQRFVSICAL